MVDLKIENTIFGVHTKKNRSDRKKNLFKTQKLSIKYLFRFLQLSKRQQEMAIDEDVESSQACPSMSYLFPGNTNYAKDIRSPLANFVPTRTKTSNLVRKLHASDFQSNNDDHLNLVKNMGINIISLPDGRVQLLHTLSNVSSQNTFFREIPTMQRTFAFLWQIMFRPVPKPEIWYKSYTHLTFSQTTMTI